MLAEGRLASLAASGMIRVQVRGDGRAGVRVGDEKRRQADAGKQSQPLPTHQHHPLKVEPVGRLKMGELVSLYVLRPDRSTLLTLLGAPFAFGERGVSTPPSVLPGR
jgi:hypothetical protein